MFILDEFYALRWWIMHIKLKVIKDLGKKLQVHHRIVCSAQ
jgi:hypothetical protein